jgi:hypothetical protein
MTLGGTAAMPGGKDVCKKSCSDKEEVFFPFAFFPFLAENLRERRKNPLLVFQSLSVFVLGNYKGFHHQSLGHSNWSTFTSTQSKIYIFFWNFDNSCPRVPIEKASSKKVTFQIFGTIF